MSANRFKKLSPTATHVPSTIDDDYDYANEFRNSLISMHCTKSQHASHRGCSGAQHRDNCVMHRPAQPSMPEIVTLERLPGTNRAKSFHREAHNFAMAKFIITYGGGYCELVRYFGGL